MTYLIADLTRFLRSSLAPSTIIHLSQRLEQCPSISIESSSVVIVSLVSRISSSTIKVYLSAVQYCSNVLGYEISMSRMYPVFYLLRWQQGSQYRRPRRHHVTLLHL